jgi:hypothetical protein
MFSWRGAIAVGDACSIRIDRGGRVILFLVIGVEVTVGAWPKSDLSQQLMEIGEGSQRRAWFTQFHAGTGSRVEHPLCNHQNYAWFNLNVNYVSGSSVLAILPSESAAIKCVPSIKNLHLLPDMGRMTPKLPLGERTGYLPEANERGSVPLPQ